MKVESALMPPSRSPVDDGAPTQPGTDAVSRHQVSPRTITVVLLLLALAKGLLWATVIPSWYGPDEASHYSYVQVMVEDHWLARVPNHSDLRLDYPPEILCSQGNLGIGVSGEPGAEPPFGAPWVYCTISSQAARHASSPDNGAALYTPLYYVGAIPLYLLAQAQSVEVRLAAVRLWSVLLGVLAAMFAYFAMRQAFPDSMALALAAAVLFILQPMNSQETAVANNDALLIAIAAAFWWRFYHSLRFGVSMSEALILGTLVAFAYVAKAHGILLATTLPILFLLVVKRQTLRAKIGRVATLTAASAGPVIISIALGGLLSTLAGNKLFVPPAAPGLHGLSQYLLIYGNNHFERLYWLWVTTFWGYFGWFQVDLPSYVYLLIVFVMAVGILGALSLLLSRAGVRLVLVASILGLLVPAVLIQSLEVYIFRSNGDLILQGRSFLMLLIPLIVVLMRGWQRLLPRGADWSLGAATVLIALTLNLTSLLIMLEAFYG
jgi:predicted membrane protein DUF2142